MEEDLHGRLPSDGAAQRLSMRKNSAYSTALAHKHEAYALDPFCGRICRPESRDIPGAGLYHDSSSAQ
jgi:hypothetical protein